MKKVDICGVTPYDVLLITDISNIKNNETIIKPKYIFGTDIMSNGHKSILSEIDDKIKLYIENRNAYSKLDLCYDNFIDIDNCDYENPRLKSEANKYMKCLLEYSGIVKLDSEQRHVVSSNGESALDVINDMYDVYAGEEYYEFLDDFINYVRRDNIKTRSRK